MSRRKLTEAEKLARKNERKAASLNAAAAKSYGPLFADMAPVYSAEDAYWHSRAVRSEMIEHLASGPAGPATRGLKAVELAWIEWNARPLVGEHFDGLAAHLRTTFKDTLGFGYGYWCKVLTGEEVAYSWKRVVDPGLSLGFRLEVADSCRLDPAPMTRAEFFQRFPYVEPVGFGVGEPDGTDEFFASVMAKIAEGCRDV